MVNVHEEVNEMYQKCIKRIESDFKEGKTLSFHHYAVKYGLNPHRLQSEWVSYNHAKKGKV